MSTGILDGRRLLVTGGTSGIGAAVIAAAAAAGATGVALDLRPSDPPGPWPVVTADVTDEGSVAAAVAEAVDLLGGLDGVVAAAGIVPSWAGAADIDLDQLDRVLAVNVRGVVATIKHTARVLAPGSAITLVGSLNSWRGDPNLAVYAASKHAVLGVLRSAALSLGPKDIRVNGVAPGPVATQALLDRMTARSETGGLSVPDALAAASTGTALGRIARPEDVADAIVFLTSNRAAAITGQLLAVDGGIL
jgi:3alpha(or 20beta)-hydroxysteroid dehydrogenase